MPRESPKARIIIIEVNESDSLADVVRELGFFETAKNVFHGGAHSVGDRYEVSGQAGAVGPNAHAQDNGFAQLRNEQGAKIDLGQLAAELQTLRTAMRGAAVTPEHDLSVGYVAQAQVAAEGGNESGALEHLKKSGQWTLGLAKQIGVHVAALAISHSIAG
ncbi:hypothetical protein [Streptomyces rubiginosohelvolus]|uniref:hypothetical protein n=1 Tax=Streptomyces rubiginosohelvolus TaxID=67362 RepID=UPI00379E4951